MKRLPVVTGCFLALTGCATSKVTRTPGPPGPGISPGERVCVAVPADGRYGSREYTGSGQILATHVVHVLQTGGYAQVETVAAPFGADLAAACKARGGRSLVTPTILHWEDRATAWSGAPDRIEVAVEVRRLDADAPPRRVVFENRTDPFGKGFGELGNAPPETLLDEEFDRTVLELAAGGSS